MRVRWTELAARDLTNICDYIHEHDGAEPARKVALSVFERVGALVQFPLRGRIGRKAGTRELVLAGTPYFAVYRVREDVIEVNRILHGAQKWP